MVQLSKLAIATVACVANVNGSRLVKEIITGKLHSAKARGDYIEDPAKRPNSVKQHPQKCEDGSVTVGDITYECSGVDFSSFVAYKDFEVKNRVHNYEADAADMWGWESPSGMEVAIITMDNGVALIDVSFPENPCVIAKLPTNLYVDIWADVKVIDNTLYHVKDNRVGDPEENEQFPEPQTTGLEVWDLLQFDGLDCHDAGYQVKIKEADVTRNEHGRAHNLVTNVETKRLYSVGTRAGACNEGFVVYDVSERLNPQFLGCVDGDGYTHDAQCVIYRGLDERYVGQEICFAFNEDTLTIWDVTDMANVTMVSRTLYNNQAYSHQGWLTADQSKILLDDELDELCNDGQYASTCAFYVASGLSGLTTTSTNVFNLADLKNPVRESIFVHEQRSIDHNLYVFGEMIRTGQHGSPAKENHPDPGFAYLNNYMAGLRILNIKDEDSTKWSEAAFFDVNDGPDDLEFFGSWSGFLFPSGTYAISSIELGLFVVQPSTAFNDEFPAPVKEPATPFPTMPPTEAPEEPLLDQTTVAVILVSFIAVVGLVAIALIVKGGVAAAPAKSPAAEEEAKPESTIKHYTEDDAKADL